MLILLEKPATALEINNAAEDLDGYIKFVVDVTLRVLTIGGARHFDGEQMLLKNGSQQRNLWGGGFDSDDHSLDFDSMINIRPNDNNPSREVINEDIRQQIREILKENLPWKI
jgi:hypothetical protein